MPSPLASIPARLDPLNIASEIVVDHDEPLAAIGDDPAQTHHPLADPQGEIAHCVHDNDFSERTRKTRIDRQIDARGIEAEDGVQLAPAAVGVKLTDSFAMWPGSSVSGLYFAHPEAKYFGVGHILDDQLESYAERKGWSLDEARQHLAPILDSGG